MTIQNDTRFDIARTALTDLGSAKVWSLIVTVMGDMAADPGAAISGACLAEILAPVGVRPEALRVALHRLRKDGWITSDKQGRSSHHSLTKSGLEQTRAAAPRIYARQLEYDGPWHLFWANPEHAGNPPAGTIKLGRGVYLGQGAKPTAKGYLCVSGAQPKVPDWLRAQLGPVALIQAYNDLATALKAVAKILGSAADLTPPQTACLRMLIVHYWRRTLLRHPDLPMDFFPENWQESACRQQVMALLDLLPRPKLAGMSVS
jgi:phenylacetic acid degradation operon negative regulatory protein